MDASRQGWCSGGTCSSLACPFLDGSLCQHADRQPATPSWLSNTVLIPSGHNAVQCSAAQHAATACAPQHKLVAAALVSQPLQQVLSGGEHALAGLLVRLGHLHSTHSMDQSAGTAGTAGTAGSEHALARRPRCAANRATRAAVQGQPGHQAAPAEPGSQASTVPLPTLASRSNSS